MKRGRKPTKQSFDGGEPSPKSTRLHIQTQIITDELTSVRLQDITGQVEFVLNTQSDDLALLGNSTSSADFASSILASRVRVVNAITNCTPNIDFLEVGNVELFDVD